MVVIKTPPLTSYAPFPAPAYTDTGLVKRTNGHPPVTQSTLSEIHSYCVSTLPCTHTDQNPTCYSPALQPTRVWRAEKKAERSAFPTMPEVSIPWKPCQLCGIYIGPGYIEKEVYFYPLAKKKTVTLSDETSYDIHVASLLVICGGCAKYHQVPERHKFIEEEDWYSMKHVSGIENPERFARTPQERVTCFLATKAWAERYIEHIVYGGDKAPQPKSSPVKKKAVSKRDVVIGSGMRSATASATTEHPHEENTTPARPVRTFSFL